MIAVGMLQVLVYLLLVLALTPFLGGYLARVLSGERILLDRVLGPVERGIYRISGIDPAREQHWLAFAASLLAFNLVSVLVLYGLLRVQHLLPLNPQGLPQVPPELAFNTAISFVTNTNWQAYGGESTLSYFSQMVGLGVQNFASAATGMAVAAALARGFSRRAARTVGHFHVDLVRSVLYVLLPLSLVVAGLLVWQGVPQNFDPYVTADTLEGGRQVIAQGPVASQVAIKQLGTNGGGFFNVNSAHPYENPTPLANFVEMLTILLIPAALVVAFGRMVGDRRQGWAIFAAMAVMLTIGILVASWAESAGSLEGKEVRFGTAASALWAVATTAASNGSVNAMHDSFTPLGGMVALVNMLLGEVVFGGVGVGLTGMLVFVMLTVFIAGLMVGRTPEYLGKKIEAREVKLAVIAIIAFPLLLLGFAALAVTVPQGVAGITAPGPHGLSQTLYAYASAVGNNGSAFAGFNANTLYHDTAIGLAILFGRYAALIPVLAIAGGLVAKGTVPPSAGTFPTHGVLFVVLLVAVVVVVGGLTFFPVLALGPIAEHLAFVNGTLY
ncbi:MAG: potassium-transporting ATPase subunit KdpA [Alphaproteobacteria bacterium]